MVFVCLIVLSPGRGREFANKFFSLSGLLYFCCGLYLSQMKKNSFPLSRRAAIMLLGTGIFMVVLKSYITFSCGRQNDRLVSLVFVPLVLAGAWTLLPAVKIPVWASRLSFPIYLLHVSVMFVGGLFFPWHAETMVGWWVKYVFALTGSVLVCWAMKRFFPRIASVAFGGRL